MLLTKVTIYGRDGCPFCVKAKDLANTLKESNFIKEIEYIDTVSNKLGKEELSEIVGKPVTTVPQIFIDGNYVGGFTEFDGYVRHLSAKHELEEHN